MNEADTIVAVSSPPGRSARGLLRISGSQTTIIMNRLIEPAATVGAGRGATQRRLVAGRVRWAGRGALPVLAALFDGPRTYTGQDMGEIQCPGNPALLDRLIHRIVSCGARLAEPGEFTFRAFTAGKMDLTAAEGVAATIAAVSDSQLEAARRLRDGQLGEVARQLVDDVADQLALVEAGIDFTDQEDVVPVTRDRLDAKLAVIGRQLADLLSHSRAWGTLEALPRVVLTGAPSTGKSTLFNALLGRRRAVINPRPGTTRDHLAEPLTLRRTVGPPAEIMLVDVAGLDAPANALDRIVQEAARRTVERADLILDLDDGRPEAPGPNRGGPSATILRVRSKSDRPGRRPDADVAVSATTGDGLEDLRRLIVDRIADRAVSAGGQMLALQPRHEAALKSALHHVEDARRILADQGGDGAIDAVELVAVALRESVVELGGLGGSLTPDDVLGRVFAKFCIGK